MALEKWYDKRRKNCLAFEMHWSRSKRYRKGEE